MALVLMVVLVMVEVEVMEVVVVDVEVIEVVEVTVEVDGGYESGGGGDCRASGIGTGNGGDAVLQWGKYTSET